MAQHDFSLKMQNLDTYEALCEAYGKNLVDTELELEAESQRLGIQKIQKKLNDDKVNNGTTKRLLAKAIPTLGNAIEQWLDEVNNKKGGGRKHTAACLIQLGDVDTIAYVTLATIFSVTLESKGGYKHSANLTKVATKIATSLEDEFRYNNVLSNISNREARCVERSLNKRLGVSYKRAFVRALERNNVESGKIEPWQKWTAQSKVSVGTKLIELAAEATGIVELELLANEHNDTFYNVSIRNEVLENIDYNDAMLISLGYINRPMVIPPKPWTEPLSGGYYMDLKSPNPFIRMNKGKLLSLYSEIDMPNVYNAVNIIQSTPWRVNKRVLEIAKEVSNWKNIPECLDFPSLEPADMPVRPAEADDNPELHNAWKTAMLRYYQNDNSRKGRRLSINTLIGLADDFKDYEAIYFPHNIDFRGRVYPLTTLNPQGSDFCKSLIEFAYGKPLADNENSIKWLAFHGANCYGLDKRPMQERFEWAYNNQQLIQDIASDPLNNTQWMSTDSPWEFLAWCFEWDSYLKEGPSYVSRIPIAFDGSCSGLQHYSAMLRDPIGGKAVNLLPSDTVQDIYSLVKDEVIKVAKEDALKGTDDTLSKDDDGKDYIRLGTKNLANEWLKFGITRVVTKRPVMTLPYGSKQYGFKDQILSDVIYPAISKDISAFSKPNQAATYMASLIWEAVHKVVVKAMAAMSWLQETSALLASQKGLDGRPIPTYWVTPAGLPVYQAYEKVKLKRIHTIVGKGLLIKDPLKVRSGKSDTDEGSTLYPSVKEIQEGSLDPRKQRQGIAPNFVHSMDASHLMLTVLDCYNKANITNFAMIHDSYGTCAADADVMYHTVREVFVKTYSENDVLHNLYEQVRLQLPEKALDKLEEPPMQGSLDLNEVLNSKYAFS